MIYLAVVPERRFSIPAPESHRGVALLSFLKGHGKVISRSDGYSVVNDRLEISYPLTYTIGTLLDKTGETFFEKSKRFFGRSFQKKIPPSITT